MDKRDQYDKLYGGSGIFDAIVVMILVTVLIFIYT